MKQNQNNTSIDLMELITLLIRKCWIIILCVLIAAGISGFYSYRMLSDYYSASATIYLGKEDTIGSIDLGTITLNNQLMSDYISLIKSRLVADEVINKLGLNIPAESIQYGLQTSSVSTTAMATRMFKISYQSSSPDMAASIVNAACEVVIQKADEIMGVQNAQIIDRALVPKWPVGPNRKKNVLLASIVGLVFGILTIFLIEFLDRTFKKPEDIEKALGLIVLGTTPSFKGERNTIKKGGIIRGNKR